MSCPLGYGFTRARFWRSVLPVTVRQSPCSMPASSSDFISGWMPPMRMSSDIEYLPLGRRSASTGTRAPMRVKSSSSSGTPAACAIASRCSTALVEPPSAIVTTMAFSNASRVRIIDGLMPCLIRLTTARPARSASVRLWRETASCAELFGETHSERLDRRRHRVGRVHAAAAARRRDGRALDFLAAACR